jgi:hypothetical protein
VRPEDPKTGDQAPSTTPGSSAQLAQAQIDVPGGFRFTLPLPKWAVGVLALMLIAGLVLVGSYWGYTRFSGKVLLPQENVDDYNETSKHDLEPDATKETQEVSFGDGVKVTIRHFHTDGCVEVLRTSQSLLTDKHWLRDLSRVQLPPPPRAALFDQLGPGQAQLASVLASFEFFHTPNITRASPSWSATPPVVSSLNSFAAQGPGCNRRCLNPHPGAFKSWNGAKNGCWLQVWRRWPEGCTHFQWFNTCYNVWDSNPDGSPKVTWTCCVH